MHAADVRAAVCGVSAAEYRPRYLRSTRPANVKICKAAAGSSEFATAVVVASYKYLKTTAARRSQVADPAYARSDVDLMRAAASAGLCYLAPWKHDGAQ